LEESTKMLIGTDPVHTFHKVLANRVIYNRSWKNKLYYSGAVTGRGFHLKQYNDNTRYGYFRKYLVQCSDRV